MSEEPFGYLGTDEEVSKTPKKADFERTVLGGCVTFSLASALQLAAAGIPLVIERELHSYQQLYGVLAIYLVAAALVGVAFTLGAGLSGLCGSLAGLVPAATFLWLRLSDKTTGVPGIEGMEPAEYPASYAWGVPGICALGLGALFCVAYWLKWRLSGRTG